MLSTGGDWRASWRPMPIAAPRAVPSASNSSFDVGVYVVTLCALGVVSSLADPEVPLEKVLGQAFLTGWFALDTCLFPTNVFCRFANLWDWGVFGGGASASLLLFWWLGDDNAFMTVHGFLAALLAVYWVLTERVSGRASVFGRMCVRILALYGVATLLGYLVCQVEDLRERGVQFQILPWYVCFVLLALGIARRDATMFNRFLFAYVWGVLVYDLSRLKLKFNQYFYK